MAWNKVHKQAPINGQLCFDKVAKKMQQRMDSLFKQWHQNNWISISQKYRILFNPLPYTKIISKWITDPDPKIKMIKFLEENIRENVRDLELDKDFLDMI